MVTGLVLAALILSANLPFMTHRFLFVIKASRPKSFGLHLLEMLVYVGLTVALLMWLESALGQRAEQGWAFYVTVGCVAFTLAFPGFVWRFLWCRR